MNLQKVTGRPFSCICNNCHATLSSSTDEVYADLDGKAFKSFYCSACKSLKESEESHN